MKSPIIVCVCVCVTFSNCLKIHVTEFLLSEKKVSLSSPTHFDVECTRTHAHTHAQAELEEEVADSGERLPVGEAKQEMVIISSPTTTLFAF